MYVRCCTSGKNNRKRKGHKIQTPATTAQPLDDRAFSLGDCSMAFRSSPLAFRTRKHSKATVNSIWQGRKKHHCKLIINNNVLGGGGGDSLIWKGTLYVCMYVCMYVYLIYTRDGQTETQRDRQTQRQRQRQKRETHTQRRKEREEERERERERECVCVCVCVSE